MLTKLIPIKFTPHLYNDLKVVAQQLGVPMAEIVRNATQKELKKLQKQPKLSDLTQFAQAFPKEANQLSDDEILYGKE